MMQSNLRTGRPWEVLGGLLLACSWLSAQNPVEPRWSWVAVDAAKPVLKVAHQTRASLVVGLSSRGELQLSRDGGNEWVTMKQPHPGQAPAAFGFVAEDSGAIYASTAGGDDVMISMDEGETWREAEADGESLTAAAQLGDATVTGSVGGKLRISDTGVVHHLKRRAVSAIAVDHGYRARLAVFYEGFQEDEADCRAFETTDRGANWSCVEGRGEGRLPDEALVSAAYLNGQLVVLTSEGLYVHENGSRWKAGQGLARKEILSLLSMRDPDGSEVVIGLVQQPEGIEAYRLTKEEAGEAREAGGRAGGQRNAPEARQAKPCTPTMRVLNRENLHRLSPAAQTHVIRVEFPYATNPSACVWRTWITQGSSGAKWIRTSPSGKQKGPKQLRVSISANKSKYRVGYINVEEYGNVDSSLEADEMVSQLLK
jgi:photosystem II stability/assembly factor-like uncharacterized protein